jgi:hypothetical protein
MSYSWIDSFDNYNHRKRIVQVGISFIIYTEVNTNILDHVSKLSQIAKYIEKYD